MDSVIITGATGFIGSHIAGYFCSKGVRVGCLVRKGSDDKNIKRLPVEVHSGDITDFQSLAEAFKGYRCVIHNAACAKDWGRYDEFFNTNVKGTVNVLKAAYENGIRDVIITGSISAYGEEDSNIIKDESSPQNSHYRYFADRIFPCRLNFYRDTKALAKLEAIKYASEKGINLTILEPVWVYGPREFNTGFYEYMKTAKNGIPFLPGSRKNRFHVVYVKDLARAYHIAFEKRLKGINPVIIGNRSAEYMDRIYSLFCLEMGVKKPLNLPKLAAYPLGFIMELIYTVLNIKTPPLLTRGRVNMFYDSIEYSARKAEELLGFSNSYSLEEGIRETVRWYKEMGLL